MLEFMFIVFVLENIMERNDFKGIRVLKDRVMERKVKRSNRSILWEKRD